MLKRNKTLRRLDLGQNAMGPKQYWTNSLEPTKVRGAGANLGLSLKFNPSLTELSLAENALGEELGPALAKGLRNNLLCGATGALPNRARPNPFLPCLPFADSFCQRPSASSTEGA